jgi:hypothetical protein
MRNRRLCTNIGDEDRLDEDVCVSKILRDLATLGTHPDDCTGWIYRNRFPKASPHRKVENEILLLCPTRPRSNR